MVTLVAASACGCGPSHPFDPPLKRLLASREGRIASTRATSFSSPNFESAVYGGIDADGSGLTRPTDDPAEDSFPA